MSRDVSASIFVGVPATTQMFKESFLKSVGVDLENYIDTDYESGYDIPELVWCVERYVDGLCYCQNYDTQDHEEFVVGMNIFKTFWDSEEIDLDSLKIKEVELTLKLQEIFKDSVDIETYLVPTYL